MSEVKIDDWAMPKIKNFRTYIDIGASNGKTSFPYVNKFKRIICFEPNPKSFVELSSNERLECHNIALGDIEEIKTLIVNSETQNPEHGSISEIRNKDWTDGEKFEVQVKRLDDYKFFDDVDFIKIDTEQYELNVIKGAVKTLKKNRPTIMFENKRNEADEAIIFLLDLGFTVKKYKSDTIAFYEDNNESN